MKFAALLSEAGRSIARTKGRSFLTSLGIIVGIGSVIALLAIGTGVRDGVEERIGKLGTSSITIRSQDARAAARQAGRPGPPRPGGGFGPQTAVNSLTEADYRAVLSTDGIASASPQVTGSADISASGGTPEPYGTLGVSPAFFSIAKLEPSAGRLLTGADDKAAVLGWAAAASLFPGASPVGKEIVVAGETYPVVGTLREPPADQVQLTPAGDLILVPYAGALKRSGSAKYGTIAAKADSDARVDQASVTVTRALLALRPGSDPAAPDFSVGTAKELLATIGTLTALLTSALAGIAAISLLVAGIGIMNIMLVSVTERTREIGLRRAVGARSRDVIAQFLTESVLLTVLGGALGIGFGWLLAKAAERFADVVPRVTAGNVVLAVGVSAAIGILFGLFPAIAAARKDPVEALRAE